MSRITRILVAIGNPHSLAQTGLQKAIHLARRTGAELEVFHALYDPAIQIVNAYQGTSAAPRIQDAVEETRTRLEKLVAQAGCDDLPVRVSVHWDYPAHEAIVRQVMRRKSTLVVAETRRHDRTSRLFLNNTDWQLIRLCPVPLLLVKSQRPWTTAKVLAPIDPLHTRAKPTALDPRILKVGTQLARALGSQLHVVHVYAPLLGYAPGLMTEPLPLRIEGKAARDYRKDVRKRVLKESRRFRVSERFVHLIEGDPSPELVKLAQRMKAQLVVMGAVSRTGLKRLFIGNTAERLLDALPCDICVVKAPGFRTPVKRRS